MNNWLLVVSNLSNFVHGCFAIAICFSLRQIYKELLEIHRDIHALNMKVSELMCKKSLKEIDEHFANLRKLHGDQDTKDT